MKVLNILGIILSVLLIALTFYFIDENDTEQAAIVTFLFFLLFMGTYIGNLVTSKRGKAISILGIIFTVFMMAWDAAMYDSPSHISFDEVGAAWLGYAVICIVFFSLSLRKPKTKTNDSLDIIDDGMIE